MFLLSYMTGPETTKLSSRGQVVIPRAVRDKLGLEEGEILVVYGEDDTIILRRVPTPDPEELERILEWGERFAKEEGITRKDVERAIREVRAGAR